jgi:penicillin V acylase-like amidase (Ntn superfamily)
MIKLHYLKVIFFLLLSYQFSFCCTILTSSSSDAVFAGNNEDMCSTNTMIHIIPPNDNKYGHILRGFAYDENYQGGMNEYGLFFDGAGLPHVDMPKQSLPEYDGAFVMEGVLENCKTVEEAITYLKNYELSFLAFCHILIAEIAQVTQQ